MSDSVSVPTGYGNVTRVSVNLTITNASREDTGVYICSANNSVGSDNESINITVQCKFIVWNTLYTYVIHNNFNYVVQAKVISDVADFIENETKPVTLSCQATGEPVPSISWYFNNILTNTSNIMINTSNTNKYNISDSINENVITSLLTIVSAQSSDVGTYTCYAENIIGNDQNTRILTVNDKKISFRHIFKDNIFS